MIYLEPKTITINGHDFDLVDFFDHDNQQYLLALKPVAPPQEAQK